MKRTKASKYGLVALTIGLFVSGCTDDLKLFRVTEAPPKAVALDSEYLRTPVAGGTKTSSHYRINFTLTAPSHGYSKDQMGGSQ